MVTLQELKNEMTVFNSVQLDKIKTYQFKQKNLTNMRIRDMLFRTGNILVEDLDRSLYIASVRSGFLKMNTAIVGFNLSKNNLNIAVFVKEGLLKQNTCEGIVNEIKNELKAYIV